MGGQASKVALLEIGTTSDALRDLQGQAEACGMGRFEIVRLAWGAGQVGLSVPAEAKAIIAAIGPDQSATTSTFLDCLEARRPAAPVLGLLAPDLPGEVARRAALLVDDLLFPHVGGAELCTRLWRLTSGAGADPASAVARRLSRDLGMRALIGRDAGFRKLVDGIPRIAASDATVLVTGETGTGKELYARAVHHLGPRRDHPFIAVDCGAFPEQLIENELFGHAPGAFTDARTEHKGLARMAEGGVLFLDEVDALSLVAQGKLLRFLQERTFKPLGDQRIRQADVRVVAATNRDLAGLVKEGRFRSDLFFRLSVLLVGVMPLRERPDDIPLLAAHFLAGTDGARQRQRRFSAAAEALLRRQRFPGNVRELFNLVQRAAVMIESDEIDALDLVELLAGADPGAGAAGLEPSASFIFREAKARAIEEFERGFVTDLLRKHHGNVTRASREAGKDRRAFGRLVKKYGLQP